MTDQTARTPYCHKIRYGITGAPTLTEDEMDGSHAPGVGVRPTLIELVYHAARDGKPASVAASVTGDWTRFGERDGGQVTTHFKNGPNGWPNWLADEARLHAPAVSAAVAPATDQTSPAGDRLFALIASIPGSGQTDWCGPARALLAEIRAEAMSPAPAADDPDWNSDEDAAYQTERRDRYAAAIWERQNPGRRYTDCEHPWQADAEEDALVVMAVADTEQASLRAEVARLRNELHRRDNETDQPHAPAPAADRAGLRELIADAIRKAACNGDCGKTEEECAKERIQPFAWHHGRLAVVEGKPEQFADAVLAALLGPIPAGTDTATWTAIRAIQLMNEAGREREAHRLALSEALGLGTSAPWDAIHERVKVLAVLPTTDRAAILRDAADMAYRRARQLDDQQHDERAQGAWDVENSLRSAARIAAGAQQQGGLRGLLAHVGIDTTGRDITVDGKVVDAGAQQQEAVVTVHADPNLSPAAQEALGALVDVAKQQFDCDFPHPHPEHPCGRRVAGAQQQTDTEARSVPETTAWMGATELAPDRVITALAASGLVGYRQDSGRLLHCLAHKPAPVSRYADFHEVTAADLDDGGICVHPDCGRDLLAPWPSPPAQQPAAATAYGDGKGRVYCLGCAHTVGADVPLTAHDVDHWELCPSCGRHVVDVARTAMQQPTAEAPSIALARQAQDQLINQITEPQPAADGGEQAAARTQVRSGGDPDRIIGYRSKGGRLLRCLAHHPGREAVESGDFRPVTSDELPDGGTCTLPDCGVDVLIPQPADEEASS